MWTWQHRTQNHQGTVTNLHERTRAADGSVYNYQHSVTRPNGSHTQLREYSQTADGYLLSRQHRFYRPDGTLLREQGMSVTGTDPYNYQRQMSHVFRDGRTLEKTFTRSYDGTTGTMSHSFLGPNGQVREFERPWTPDDLVAVEPPTLDSALPPLVDPTLPVTGPTAGPLATTVPVIIDPLAPDTAPSSSKSGFMGWLNPFKNRDSKKQGSSSAMSKRGGFTVGSFGQSRRMDTMPPGQARKASGQANMRPMKTEMNRTGPPAHAASNSHGKSSKMR
jgi:hypothetical protein